MNKRPGLGFGILLALAGGLAVALAGTVEASGMMTKRQQIEILSEGMKAERQRYEPFYREVDRNIVPGLYRGQLSDRGRGERLDEAILDSTPTMAHQVLEAGFTAHVTPPGKIWHHWKVARDPDLAEYGPVARWMDDVTRIQFATYEQAGMYEMLQPFYGYMGSFGSACLWTEERYEPGESPVYLRNLPAGSWWISLDDRGMPNAFRREMRLNVRQVVDSFARYTRSGSPDWANFSPRVRSAYDRGQYLEHVDVGHVVYLNPNFDPHYGDAAYKRFTSCYYELGAEAKGPDGEGLFLRESGYDQFPALYGPWDLIGEDTYGYRCPGRTVLADVKQLYDDVLTFGKSKAQLADPTLMGTQAAVDAANRVGYLPGRFIPVAKEDLKDGGLRPISQAQVRVAEMQAGIEDLRRRVEHGYHVDTFRMLDYLEDRERTAFEISVRQEERLVMLVGVLNRLSRRVLFPMAERVFQANLRQGYLPPIPEELEGQNLEVEIVSNMAQAMRAMGLGAIERVLGVVAGIAEYYPQITDKVDLDQVVDEIAKGTGAPARIIVDDRTVAEIRAERAQAQAAQQAALEAEQAAKTVKALSDAKTQGPGGERNALQDVLAGLRGGQA